VKTTTKQLREFERQAEIQDDIKLNKEMEKLWEEFKQEYPNTVDGFMNQWKSFRWLFFKLKKQSK
jgi:hypothetical protein